jgi:hypothetical protein
VQQKKGDRRAESPAIALVLGLSNKAERFKIRVG